MGALRLMFMVQNRPDSQSSPRPREGALPWRGGGAAEVSNPDADVCHPLSLLLQSLVSINSTTQHLASHRRPRRGLAPRRLGRSHRPALVSSGDGTHTTKVSGADILHAVSEGDPVVLSELAAERRASDHEEL